MERKIREIRYSAEFLKNVVRLPKNIIEKTKEKELLFRENVFNPTLRAHKLHGKNREAWAFWVNYIYRIKFVFLTENEVLFLDVGTHKIYK